MRSLTNGVIFWDTAGIRTTKLPVDVSTGTQVRIRLFAMPVKAGDLLDITAELGVTNDLGYDVGVAPMLWRYDANAPAAERPGTWEIIGDAKGMNVTPDMHHLTMEIGRLWEVPADWPEGHQAGIVLMADAHSTGAIDNPGWLKVERAGTLVVRRYRDDEGAT